MAVTLVRRCPSCGEEHPPPQQRCTCGMLLAGVDLAVASVAIAAAVAEATPAAAAGSNRNVIAPPEPAVPATPYPALEGAEPVVHVPGMRLEWPWGESTGIGGSLLIGREPPVPPVLLERIRDRFDNVSRRHALIVVRDDGAWVEDLASTNGTWVDGERLAAHRPVRLRDGAELRFAAELTATLRIDGGGQR